MDNVVIGHLCGDPVLWQPERGGQPRARFTVAVNKWRKVDGDYVQRAPVFHKVVCFGWLAENVSNTLRKGMEVLAVGEWVDDTIADGHGERRVQIAMEAKVVGPGLRWATAQVSKVDRRTTRTDPPRVDGATLTGTAPAPAPTPGGAAAGPAPTLAGGTGSAPDRVPTLIGGAASDRSVISAGDAPTVAGGVGSAPDQVPTLVGGAASDRSAAPTRRAALAPTSAGDAAMAPGPASTVADGAVVAPDPVPTLTAVPDPPAARGRSSPARREPSVSAVTPGGSTAAPRDPESGASAGRRRDGMHRRPPAEPRSAAARAG